MSPTVFSCILCLPEADTANRGLDTGAAFSEHLELAHHAPKRYVMRQTQRLLGTHATIIQWDVVDANECIVGKAETITGRGGL
jgi:hypothetical protein